MSTGDWTFSKPGLPPRGPDGRCVSGTDDWRLRLTLVSRALGGKSAFELLEGLDERGRSQARAMLEHLEKLPSEQRQAHLARELGPRSDGASRVEALACDLGPDHHEQLRRQLPPYLRNAVPEPIAAVPSRPLREEWLERLILEATR